MSCTCNTCKTCSNAGIAAGYIAAEQKKKLTTTYGSGYVSVDRDEAIAANWETIKRLQKITFNNECENMHHIQTNIKICQHCILEILLRIEYWPTLLRLKRLIITIC